MEVGWARRVGVGVVSQLASDPALAAAEATFSERRLGISSLGKRPAPLEDDHS